MGPILAKNMKEGSVKHETLCVEQSNHAEKKVENNNFHSAALHGANICQILFTCFNHPKYLESLLRATFNWSLEFQSHSPLMFCLK